MRVALALAAAVGGVQLYGGFAGLRWSDWDGRQVCRPAQYFTPGSEEEVIRVVKQAAKEGSRVKVVGAGHSFSAIALSEGAHFISLDNYRKFIRVDEDGRHVRVQGGMRLFELNEELHKRGLALRNMGATAEQSLAGVTSTGTHGTGRDGSISTFIQAMRIVTADGAVHEVSRETKDPEERQLFDAGRVGLGALGVLTEMTLDVVPLFKLRLQTISIGLDHLLPQLPQLLKDHERVQWYYFPFTGENATLVVRTQTTEPETPGGCWNATTPSPHIGKEGPGGGTIVGDCTDVAYKAMTGSPPHYKARSLYTEMEMFVPAEHLADAIKDFRAYQDEVEPQHNKSWSVFTGVRYVHQDDIWMSPQYRGPSAVLSTIVQGHSEHETGDPGEFALFAKGMEKVTAKYGGVPHWGKMNWATYEDVATRYERFQDFNKLRKRVDPTSMFMNEYLTRLLEPATVALV